MSTLCGIPQSYIILEDENLDVDAPTKDINNDEGQQVAEKDDGTDSSVPSNIDGFDMSSLPQDDDEDSESDKVNNATVSTLPELIPLKKYLLLQDLADLQSKLKDNKDIYFNSLDTILKFGKNFRYETLLLIVIKLLDEFESKVLNKKPEEKNLKDK